MHNASYCILETTGRRTRLTTVSLSDLDAMHHTEAIKRGGTRTQYDARIYKQAAYSIGAEWAYGSRERQE
jgi:hypothetical protein